MVVIGRCQLTYGQQMNRRSVGHGSLYWRLAENTTCPCRASKDSSDSQFTAYTLYQLSYDRSTKSKILYINLKRSICSQIPFLTRKESMHMRSPRCMCVWPSWIRASWYDYESNQQDATIQVNLLFLVSSTCFGRCCRPSSGALDCIYSIW